MAGPVGFHIADGYVKVHAFYDKGELKNAAEDAARQWDRDFDNAPGDRNGGRNGNGRNGGGSGGNGRNGGGGGRDRIIIIREGGGGGSGGRGGRRGSTTGDFFTSLLNVGSFGQAAGGSKLGSAAGRAGAAVGLVFVTEVISTVAGLITSLLPIALGGALVAMPLVALKKRWSPIASAILEPWGKAIGDRFKSLSGGLLDVLTLPFVGAADAILDTFKAIKGPLTALVRQLGPAIEPFVRGFGGFFVNFVKALGPAMPGITAGLQEWGRQLPLIGRALGDMFTKILRDPEKVRKAIQGVSFIVQGLFKLGGFLVGFFTNVFIVWTQISMGMQRFWQNAAGPLKRIWEAFQPLKKAILDVVEAFKQFALADAKDAPKRWKELVEKLKAVWKPLKKFLGQVFKEAWDKVKEIWKSQVVPWVANTVGPWLKKKFKELMAAAGRAMISEAKTQFSQLKTAIIAKLLQMGTSMGLTVKRAIDKVVNFFKSLPGKAKAALSGLKAAILSKLAGAGTWLYNAGTWILNGLISGVRAGIRILKGVLGGVTGMIPSWKGPPERDSRLLFDNGKRIMGGLLGGLQRGTEPVKRHLQGLTADMPGMTAGGRTGRSVTNSSTFSPTISVTVQAGLDPVDGAARRALVRGLHIELDKFQRSYA
jgi:hypothetical protein